MTSSKNIEQYEKALENFSQTHDFESTVPEIETEITVSSVGDGHYDHEEEILTVKVGLEGPDHQLAEGIERDITVQDQGAEAATVHEGTHREFFKQHSQQLDRAERLEENDSYQEVRSNVGDTYIEENRESFSLSNISNEKSLEDWKEETASYVDTLISEVEEICGKDIAEEAHRSMALEGINEHLARIAENLYNGEEVGEINRENTYVTEREFQLYTLRGSDVTRANMQEMAESASENSLGELINMDENELIDRFYEGEI